MKRTRWWLLAASVVSLLGCRGSLDTGGTVAIPPGTFTMGSTLQDRAEAVNAAARFGGDVSTAVTRIRDEAPAHRVRTPAYFIMAYPVTQAEYAAYVYSTGAPEPWLPSPQETSSHDASPSRFIWERGRPRKERMEQPAVLVSQIEAAAYCRWWGEQRDGVGSLPSEAQWERAARGTDVRPYPWGMGFDPSLANTKEGGRRDLEPVGSRAQNASPNGVQDMVGNVAEWTTDEGGDAIIVKGGSWRDDLVSARIAARLYRPATLRDVSIGFRCVLQRRP